MQQLILKASVFSAPGMQIGLLDSLVMYELNVLKQVPEGEFGQWTLGSE